MKFPHQTLIEKNEIYVKRLPKELQETIKLFDEKLEAYETAEKEEDEQEVRELKAELKKLSKDISDEILEWMDGEEIGEEEEETELPKDKAGILKFLYEKGIKKVTKGDLKKYGYPVGFFSSFPIKGERAGNYKVFRNNAEEEFYQIAKVR